MTVFDALVGQQHVLPLLAAAAREPTHAFLITGPPGSGRSVAARGLAAALQCDSATGCGQCAACRSVLAGSHPDVSTLSTEARFFTAEMVRGLLVRRGAEAPVTGRWRVHIVEDADRFNAVASAAVLKTLEEPGPRTIVVLCAPSSADLDVTIVSRCRRIALRQPPVADVTRLLIGEGVERVEAGWAAQVTQGHIGRARRLARDHGARDRRQAVLQLPTRLGRLPEGLAAVDDLVGAVADTVGEMSAERNAAELTELKTSLGVGVRGRSVRGAAGAVKDLEAAQKARAKRLRRDELDLALLDLVALYRDVLAAQLGVPADLAVHTDQTQTVLTLARTSTPARTMTRIDAILATRRLLTDTESNEEIMLSAMALALR